MFEESDTATSCFIALREHFCERKVMERLFEAHSLEKRVLEEKVLAERNRQREVCENRRLAKRAGSSTPLTRAPTVGANPHAGANGEGIDVPAMVLPEPSVENGSREDEATS